MIVYKLQNKMNGKIYIGQTANALSVRISKHSRTNSLIGKALRKYGLQSFTILIIDEAHSKNTLDEKEKYWIAIYNSQVPNGYNFTNGGDGCFGYRHSEDIKRKISLLNTGR